MSSSSTTSSTSNPQQQLQYPDVVNNLKTIKQSIVDHCKSINRNPDEVTLVAVGKTKPVQMIADCFSAANHLHFGENYVQELLDKAPQISTDVKWHFIGTLQSNKCKLLATIPNLWVVETVYSVKLVNTLNNAIGKAIENGVRSSPLNVFVQVNTSAEESKSGCIPADCVKVVKAVKESEHLTFKGLMTIGAFDVNEEQPDFTCLKKCRKQVSEELSIAETEISLSMGMSHDYKEAITFGSNNVRVGSSIFGKRNYNK